MKINITLYQTCAGIYVKITTDILVPLMPTRGSSSLTDGSPSAHLRRLSPDVTLWLSLSLGERLHHWRVETKRFTSRHHCSCSDRSSSIVTETGGEKKVWLRWVKWWTTCCKLQCWVVHNMCCTHEGIHRWGVSCFKHRHCWQYEIH